MPSGTHGMSKTERILRIYHLLRFCDEVSFKEIDDNGIHASKKTLMRDIDILRKAGVDVRYSAKRKAYVSYGRDDDAPGLSENTAEARYLGKIKRLISLCNENLPERDCDIWYMENVPGATRRTMQRDFAILRTIGYDIKYRRNDDGFDDEPPRHYYCEVPLDIYGLYDRS